MPDNKVKKIKPANLSIEVSFSDLPKDMLEIKFTYNDADGNKMQNADIEGFLNVKVYSNEIILWQEKFDKPFGIPPLSFNLPLKHLKEDYKEYSPIILEAKLLPYNLSAIKDITSILKENS